MNTVQNGKGDRPRNNSSPQWYENYESINWHRNDTKRQDEAAEEAEGRTRRNGKTPERP